jgi:hypothetical protein
MPLKDFVLLEPFSRKDCGQGLQKYREAGNKAGIAVLKST